MKYLLSIVLLALIGVTTPKKTTPAYDWGSVSAKPDLSWADQVGAQRTPKNTEWDAGKFGLRNDTSVFSTSFRLFSKQESLSRFGDFYDQVSWCL